MLLWTVSVLVTGDGVAQGQTPSLVQPWGLPPLLAVGPVEKFADVSGTPQGEFLEGGAFNTQGNLRGIILGIVPISNNDAATTNFAFGGPDNQSIYLEGATSGTFWRFKAPYPGLIGPGGVRLPAQP